MEISRDITLKWPYIVCKIVKKPILVALKSFFNFHSENQFDFESDQSAISRSQYQSLQ